MRESYLFGFFCDSIFFIETFQSFCENLIFISYLQMIGFHLVLLAIIVSIFKIHFQMKSVFSWGQRIPLTGIEKKLNLIKIKY